MNRPLFLTGFMGSGKTAVGKELAALLGCPFVDVDSLVEQEFGMSVAQIFRSRGEPSFREAEARLLRGCAGRPLVVATGGGAVLDPASARFMKDSGILVYLRARPGTLARRLAAERASRPLLASNRPLDREVGDLLAARRGVYEQAAWIVDTDDLGIGEVARTIEKRLRDEE